MDNMTTIKLWRNAYYKYMHDAAHLDKATFKGKAVLDQLCFAGPSILLQLNFWIFTFKQASKSQPTFFIPLCFMKKDARSQNFKASNTMFNSYAAEYIETIYTGSETPYEAVFNYLKSLRQSFMAVKNETESNFALSEVVEAVLGSVADLKNKLLKEYNEQSSKKSSGYYSHHENWSRCSLDGSLSSFNCEKIAHIDCSVERS